MTLSENEIHQSGPLSITQKSWNHYFGSVGKQSCRIWLQICMPHPNVL